MTQPNPRRHVTLPAEAVDFIADVARAQHMPIYQLVIEAVQLYALYRNPIPKSDNPAPSKPRYAPRCTILTPIGAWHAARLKLLARLAGKCKVAK